MEGAATLIALANAVSALAIAYVAVRTFYRKKKNGNGNGGLSGVG